MLTGWDASSRSTLFIMTINNVHKYTLNEKQKMVFYLYCSDITNNEPNLVFMGGKGGTGKSRVIEAIEDYFKSNGLDKS